MGFPTTEGKRSFSHLSFSDFLNRALLICKKHGLSLAGWKRPEDSHTNLIISSSKPAAGTGGNIFQRSGFILNPYENRDPHSATWIYPDLTMKFDGNMVHVTREPAQGFTDILNQIVSGEDHKSCDFHQGTALTDLEGTTRNLFLNYVEKIIQGIRSNRFEKVVPARIKTVSLGKKQSPGAIFDKLINTYASAFKYIISHPHHGTWLGASPELFGHWINEHEFHTISMAGTQRAGRDTGSSVQWNEKEREEQEMVTRFIVEKARKLGIGVKSLNGPLTVRAGQLHHLKTEIRFDLEKHQSVVDIAFELHPTPAVCGLPRNATDLFIRENEPFRRDLYAGFLGPVNIDNSSDIYVNLRCLKLNSGRAYLFAGAGVTRLSFPEKEWLETEYKCETVNRVLSDLE